MGSTPQLVLSPCCLLESSIGYYRLILAREQMPLHLQSRSFLYLPAVFAGNGLW
jgi:hypothetical protein